MRVGQDVTLARIKDHAGSRALELWRVATARLRHIEEPVECRVSKQRIGGLLSVIEPRVATFTTAGATRRIMGASDGIGVSSADWPARRRRPGPAAGRLAAARPPEPP